jgi:uncharacterized protein YciI
MFGKYNSLLIKAFCAVICFVAFSNIGLAQESPVYDKKYADSLGADERGMKVYIFVILKTGKAVIDDKAQVSKLFRGHLENINKLAKEGKLVVAGPFKKNDKEFRGIFILNVQSILEAEALLKTDHAIENGLLEPEIYEWYGSAALPEYLKYVEKATKKKF